MTWNYRIVKYLNGDGFGLHEVYYDDGKVSGMTKDPIVVGDTRGEVIDALNMAMRDATYKPVFYEPEVWPSKRKSK